MNGTAEPQSNPLAKGSKTGTKKLRGAKNKGASKPISPKKI